MNAILISIGDELILGQTIDTNSAWLAQQLAAIGCDILSHTTVPDNQPAIESAIRNSAGRCDYLLISGGIGPTEDDLTRQALAAVLNQPLELNEKCLHRLEAFFRKLNRPMPESNKIQAMIPRTAKVIENEAGTASGIETLIEGSDPRVLTSQKLPASDEYRERLFGKMDVVKMNDDSLKAALRAKRSTTIFVMPGVPKEMKLMFTNSVLPQISQSTAGAVILSRTLHTFGQGESTVAEKLGPLMNRANNPSVGTTVANGIVSLRINARFPNKTQAQQQLDQTTTQCQAALGDAIFGQDNDTLPHVVANLLTSNQQPTTSNSPLTITTAESCTGGLLAKMLTDIPGSSAYFKQGWITYSNQAKYDRLGVSLDIINIHGAVSEPVVELMATHARRLAKSAFALAISGIAGPDGGTPTKPVGTVCISLAHQPPDAPKHSSLPTKNSALTTRTFLFPGDREAIRDRSAKMALTMLRYHLLNKLMPF